MIIVLQYYKKVGGIVVLNAREGTTTWCIFSYALVGNVPTIDLSQS